MGQTAFDNAVDYCSGFVDDISFRGVFYNGMDHWGANLMHHHNHIDGDD